MINSDDLDCLKIYDHYQDENTNSMEDVNQVGLETRMIMKHIPRDRVITLLDCGCGEGVSTEQYSKLPNVKVTGLDASETRIKMARERCPGVEFVCKDILSGIDKKYDIIVSQRFLSNIPNRDLKAQALDRITWGGWGGCRKMIFMEGSIQGHDEMNILKKMFGLPPNPIKWHNNFIDDLWFENIMKGYNYNLVAKEGIGAYILLTRCIRPFFEKDLPWDCDFNRIAASDALNDFFKTDKFSRIKMWVYEKQ